MAIHTMQIAQHACYFIPLRST